MNTIIIILHATMIIGLKDKMHNYLPKTHLSFQTEIGMMESGGIHLMDIGKVLVSRPLLGILTVSIRQHPWIWRISLTTPKSQSHLRRFAVSFFTQNKTRTLARALPVLLSVGEIDEACGNHMVDEDVGVFGGGLFIDIVLRGDHVDQCFE